MFERAANPAVEFDEFCVDVKRVAVPVVELVTGSASVDREVLLTKRRKPEPFLMVIEASYKPSVLDRENVPLIKWSHGPPTSAQEEGAKTKDAIPITSSLPSFMNAM